MPSLTIRAQLITPVDVLPEVRTMESFAGSVRLLRVPVNTGAVTLVVLKGTVDGEPS